MSTEFTDDKDRVIFKIGDNGRIAIGRFPDLSEWYKNYIVDTYKETVDCTDEDVEALIRFLNFEDDEEEFCV